jgi:hypothetical protein
MMRRAGRAARSLRPGAALAAAALGLAACSGTPAAPAGQAAGSSSARASSSSASSSSASSAAASSGSARAAGDSPAAARPASPPDAFTVAGRNPVPPNGSQDTSAQAAGTRCDRTQQSDDQHLGSNIASGFALASLPASAALLRHFLAGDGSAVSYPPGSPVARLAQASAAFAVVNREVQATVARQLRAGGTTVRLSPGELPLVPFDSAGGDLYWGFRGTQGLAVTGRGQRQGSVYVGTLTYVIADSYGFPAGDTLGGFGAPMRYLQTVCGAPQHAGGAHWFPDTITVTVAFRQPA